MKNKIEILPSNDSLAGLAEVSDPIIYTDRSSRALSLTLISPWRTEKRYPLVVFVQGSGWQTPDINYELPQLAQLAQNGMIVASVQHRDTVRDDCPAPGYLVDVKVAIRFLRAHAQKYGIDPKRVAIFGTSSGANAAQLVGVTGDSSDFKTNEYTAESDAVSVVVSCFGPSDMVTWVDLMRQTNDFATISQHLFPGDVEQRQVLANAMSPLRYVPKVQSLPCFLLMQGTNDAYVPTTQLIKMREALNQRHAIVESVLVEGGHHESNFWSTAVWRTIQDFLIERL